MFSHAHKIKKHPLPDASSTNYFTDGVCAYLAGAAGAAGAAFNALTFRASLLFRFAALFLWITPLLASLSIMEATSGNSSPASLPPLIALSSRIALRVV